MPAAEDTVRLEWMDVAVGGDIHRVVLAGVRLDTRRSLRERMDWLAGPGDGLRRLLIEPPYGRPAFCVDLVTPPVREDAEAGFVIMEVMGYPYFSGSNTMATACALLESGRIPRETDEGVQCVRLEAPGGAVVARVTLRAGRVVAVEVEGDEAFVARANAEVEVPGLGALPYDLVWSGGHYVLVEAAAVGLAPEEAAGDDALALAARIIEAVQADFDLAHPVLGEVGLPRFLHWMWPEREEGAGNWAATGGTYGHPGVLWSCPTGTGTVARLARLRRQGRAAVGATLRNTSPAGTPFEGRVVGEGTVGDCPSIRTRVRGEPRPLACMTLEIPATSPLVAERALDWLRGEA